MKSHAKSIRWARYSICIDCVGQNDNHVQVGKTGCLFDYWTSDPSWPDSSFLDLSITVISVFFIGCPWMDDQKGLRMEDGSVGIRTQIQGARERVGTIANVVL